MSRQDWVYVALGTLALASLLASIATWVRLWRDRGPRPGPPEEPAP